MQYYLQWMVLARIRLSDPMLARYGQSGLHQAKGEVRSNYGRSNSSGIMILPSKDAGLLGALEISAPRPGLAEE